jgi:hypothetical protein
MYKEPLEKDWIEMGLIRLVAVSSCFGPWTETGKALCAIHFACNLRQSGQGTEGIICDSGVKIGIDVECDMGRWG